MAKNDDDDKRTLFLACVSVDDEKRLPVTLSAMSIAAEAGDTFFAALHVPDGQPAPKRLRLEVISEDSRFPVGTFLTIHRVRMRTPFQ